MALVVASLFGLLVPAAARTGWELDTTASTSQYLDRNTGRHCGAKLGTYTFVRRKIFKSGVFAGKTEVLRRTIALFRDGREHRFHFV